MAYSVPSIVKNPTGTPSPIAILSERLSPVVVLFWGGADVTVETEEEKVEEAGGVVVRANVVAWLVVSESDVAPPKDPPI